MFCKCEKKSWFSNCCEKNCLFLVRRRKINLILNVIEKNCVHRPNLLNPPPPIIKWSILNDPGFCSIRHYSKPK